MNIVKEKVAYDDRYLVTKSGFALIWPFINVKKGDGPYELFLDNNALTKTTWLSELPKSMKGKLVINPWLALVEQWLSNPKFREDPEKRIEEFIQPFKSDGIKFPTNFSQSQAKLLRDNDLQLRTYWSIPFFFIVILKKFLDDKKCPDWKNELYALSQAGVPRLNACFTLAILLTYLKKNQSLKIGSDTSSAMSYLSSFFAFQTKKKGESEYITEGYLRNRAGDLAIWYLTPMLMQHRFESAGEPIVVTQDKALHRLIFKVIPPMIHESGMVAFSFDDDGFSDGSKIQLTKDIQNIACAPFSIPTSDEQKKKRIDTLYEFACKYCTSDDELHELKKVYSQWFLPGFGKELQYPALPESRYSQLTDCLASLWERFIAFFKVRKNR